MTNDFIQGAGVKLPSEELCGKRPSGQAAQQGRCYLSNVCVAIPARRQVQACEGNAVELQPSSLAAHCLPQRADCGCMLLIALFWHVCHARYQWVTCLILLESWIRAPNSSASPNNQGISALPQTCDTVSSALSLRAPTARDHHCNHHC